MAFDKSEVPSDIPRRDELQAVLESAARLQQIVPDAVLVGGTAAAAYAAHRLSFDHDHVVSDLVERFDIVLEALEREPDRITNRVVPGKVILGELGGIQAGVRQLRRRTPLETETCHLPGGRSVVVPTVAETLRVKGYLIVKRNQVRDYLDVAALADRYGIEWAAYWLAGIDEYYEDLVHDEGPVASQLVVQLADPHPKDVRTIRDLPRYKGLERRWQDWNATRAVLAQVAEAMAN
ncbi:hypothetical protein SAMN05216410_0496 [Sanguibacter gelidistatuariae]|uniref:Nucleotidyl transferase AbiEii toxin, Type IV TA system n=1 Tax=Sanguibacter gelidistatuariae TaxID=1814289 RepID=A0A1G6GUX1_9MICO|nr:hypothetical protein [Sanguibacter gelidistatuariae]SDB85812.1 hypothetical protein SAMN05216410_0496 [Sanguibacter gelidistatuariae]